MSRLRRFRGVLPVLVILAGAALSLIRARRGTLQYYPKDLLTYMGGYYASSDGANPYSVDDSIRSLERRSFPTAVYRFVYPPPFMLLMLPLEVVPYRYFRLAWLGVVFLASWAAVWLLSRSIRPPSRLCFAVLSASLLTGSSVLLDNLRWGQVTPLLVLSIAIMVQRGFRGAIAGIAGSAITMKAGFVPLLLLLRRKRAVATLMVWLLAVSLVGGMVFGFGSYPRWVSGVQEIGRMWRLDSSNNLSLSGLISHSSSSWLIEPIDEERARSDDVYRVSHAGEERRRISYALLAATVAAIVFAAARFRTLRRRGEELKRGYILSLAILLLTALLPFVWLHYGLFFLVPIRFLCRRGRRLEAIVMTAMAFAWGMPLGGSLGVWTSIPGLRSLIPLGWLLWLISSGPSRPAGSSNTLSMDSADQTAAVV